MKQDNAAGRVPTKYILEWYFYVVVEVEMFLLLCYRDGNREDQPNDWLLVRSSQVTQVSNEAAFSRSGFEAEGMQVGEWHSLKPLVA